MNCLFLYNPNSGRGKLRARLPYIEKKLSEKYSKVGIVATKDAEDLTERVKSAACDVIIAGGDGTFHAAIQAAEGKTLGYLPSGTVNDAARSLGIPRSLKRALGVILKGRSAEIDCMRAGGECVSYVAAAGAFTDATYNTPQAQKKKLGPLAYALYGVRHDLPLKVFPVAIDCDGRTTETDAVLVLILNGRSVAGFPVNREGSMRDGKLEVAVIRQVKRPNFFRRAGALFSLGAVFLFGIRIRKRDILFLQGERVGIATEGDVIWDFDGEKGPAGDLSVTLLPKNFRLYVP